MVVPCLTARIAIFLLPGLCSKYPTALERPVLYNTDSVATFRPSSDASGARQPPHSGKIMAVGHVFTQWQYSCLQRYTCTTELLSFVYQSTFLEVHLWEVKKKNFYMLELPDVFPDKAVEKFIKSTFQNPKTTLDVITIQKIQHPKQKLMNKKNKNVEDSTKLENKIKYTENRK